MNILAETKLPTEFGVFVMRVWGVRDEEVVTLQLGEIDLEKECLVRVHSQCFTGESLWSLKCDCREQLREAMRLISEQGSGVIIYLFQEGRGIGLVEKVKAYALQEEGLDTVEANVALGHAVDARDFGVAVEVLKEMGLGRIALLTNNPEKVEALEAVGLEVRRVALEVPVQDGDRSYLETKKVKLGHLLEGV